MHEWQFFSAGGFLQVGLDRGEDLAHLRELDQKLWVALACPVDGIEFDRDTLALLDADGDGRIRAPELLAALDWTLERLVSADELLAAGAALPLAALRGDGAGAVIGAAARRVLRESGDPNGESIGLDAAVGAADLLAARALNGDGVVTAMACGDTPARELVEAIVAAGFGVTDRSGEPGASTEAADAFLAAVEATRSWRAEALADAALLPVGEATAAAAEAVAAVRAKVDDWFARCALVRFDARAEAALNREESAWLALAAQDLTVDAPEVRAFPLARVVAAAELPLVDGLNPAWAAAIAVLREAAVCPLFGERRTLAEVEWRALLASLAPFEAWQARKPGAVLDALDSEGLEACAAPARRTALATLIAADLEVEPEFAALTDLLRLIRLRRDLARFCRNFVSFEDFYARALAGSFQYGTLFIDQRACALCMKVTDAARHATLAGMAGIYLAYCECRRPSTGETMQIVATVTDGDSENLLVGRNGLFYDREGRDWDATITRIVDNPISVRQAFWNPYKKVARFIEQQVAKRAAAADASGGQHLQTTVVTVPATPATPTPGAPAAAPLVPARRIDVGMVAALGVALGSLGTAFGYFLRTIAEIRAWQFPLLLAGIVLAISGPSMILAWLKLRRRNLAPLLDASGWAINARALVNVPFGATLTTLAAMPPGASAMGGDRFATHRSVWPRMAVFAFLTWWLLAFLADTGLLARLLAVAGG